MCQQNYAASPGITACDEQAVSPPALHSPQTASPQKAERARGCGCFPFLGHNWGRQQRFALPPATKGGVGIIFQEVRPR